MIRLLRLRCSFCFWLSIALALAFTGCGSSSGPASQPAPALSVTVDGVAETALWQQDIPGMTVALAKNGTMLYVQA